MNVQTTITNAPAILGSILKSSTKTGSNIMLKQKVTAYVSEKRKNSDRIPFIPLTLDLKVTCLWKMYAFMIATIFESTIESIYAIYLLSIR
jgi:hypothetical protein